MDSPRIGLRRARVTSWAMIGVGIVGVAGASAQAYADTVKPAVAEEIPDDAVAEQDAQIPSFVETPAPEPELVTPAPELVTTTDAPPPSPSPATTSQPAPVYTPRYTPDDPPPPSQPKAPPTTKRRSLTPTTVISPNYSPHVTISRGS